MAADDSARRSSGDKPAILSRDENGNEHPLRVDDHPAGMISICDDEMARFLSPSATAALVLDLVHATASYLPVRDRPPPGSPGPFSARF